MRDWVSPGGHGSEKLLDNRDFRISVRGTPVSTNTFTRSRLRPGTRLQGLATRIPVRYRRLPKILNVQGLRHEAPDEKGDREGNQAGVRRVTSVVAFYLRSTASAYS